MTDYQRKNHLWSWETIAKYYNTEKLLHTDRAKQSDNKGGSIGELFRNAYKEAGIVHIPDQSAYGYLNLAKSLRLSSEDYTQGNLRIVYNTIVTSLSIDENGFVNEVNFIQNDDKNTVFAVKPKREVITSAGTTSTPKILMLSGLGPEQYLKKLGIKSQCDLPVGQNLLDHFVVPYFFKVPCTKVTGLDSNPRGKPYQSLDFIALINSTISDKMYSNLMNTCRMVQCKDTTTMKMLLEDLPNDLKNQVLDELNTHNIFVVGIHNIKPKSRGAVKLKSKDPFDPLIIEYNLLSSRTDVDTILAGIRLQKDLLQSETFKKYRITELTPRIKECNKKVANSQAFWECYVKAVGTPLEDPVGTAKMGSQADPKAVVDACFQVFGTQNLRVIDESVIPSAIVGPTYSYVEQIGERGAQLIMEDYS